MEGVHVSYFLNGAAFMVFAYVSFRLLINKSRSRIQTILGLTLAFWALLEVKDILLYFPSISTKRLTDAVVFFDGWAVAACSFYLLELTAPGWISIKKVCLLMLPYFLFTAVYFLTFAPLIFNAYFIFIAIYSAVIVLIVSFAARRYQRYIRNNYSYPEHIDVSWLKKATFILATCLITWIFTSIHVSGWGDSIYYLSSVILWLVIIYYSDQQVSIPMPDNLKGNLLNTELEETEEAESGKAQDTSYPFSKRLITAMEEEQLYLNPKLTISDVANLIGTNRTYLSNYFNNALNTTFYDYVNNYRIEKASKQLLKDHASTLSTEQVAERSGFNSTSTFRRAFQKNTGMTPQQFRKQAQRAKKP